MSAVAPKLITAEEFARMPDPPGGSKQELVRGVIVTIPPPGFRHEECQVNIAARLQAFAKEKRLGRVTVESGMVTERGPDTVRGPDIAFWSFDRLPADQDPVATRKWPRTFASRFVRRASRGGRCARRCGST